MDDAIQFIRESDITAFRQAYLERFGIELDNSIAKHELIRLVRLVALICKPTHGAQGIES